RILAETAELNIRSDKRKHPAHGLFGGREGAPSMSIINPGSEDRIVPVMLTVPERLRRGDVLLHTLPGAGGYGDPLERDPALVLQDVVADKVSRERAATDYGVVVDDSDPPGVDEASTQALRARMRNGSARA